MNKQRKSLKIQVVLSGIPGYFKLRSQYDDMFKLTAISLRNCLDYLESKMPANTEIHGLFNAYIEEVMARRSASDPINEPFAKIFHRGMHADSGGLQMITLSKKEITKEDREKIYKTQAAYSDYAMSFDEIPSVFKDKIKYYLPHTVEQKGIESGNHLKEQYDFFDNLKTDCKIIPIVQGWGVEDTDTFSKGLFGKLSPKQLRTVDMIASGFAVGNAYGTVRRIYDMCKLTAVPKKALKKFHLLGVTGFKRLIPALQLIKNGFASQLEVLSFDSVKLPMCYVNGTQIPSIEDLIVGKTRINLGKQRNAITEQYWQRIYDFWKDDPNFVFDDLNDFIEHSYYNKDGLITGYRQYNHYLQADEEGNYTAENKVIADLHFVKVLKQEQYYILYHVYNYVNILESFLEDKLKLEHFFDGKDLEIFSSLAQVKTEDQFEEWFRYVEQVTGFKVPVMDENFVSNDTIAKSIFGDDVAFIANDDRKKSSTKSKIVKQDDTSVMDSLF